MTVTSPGTKKKSTVKILKIRTPEKFALIIIIFEQGGFTVEQCIKTMQTELQTV